MVMAAERETEYLTPEELAEHFRVNVRTIYRLAKRGDLRAVRVGKLYRIPRTSFEAFITGNPV